MFLLRTGPSGTIEDLVPFWFPGTRPAVGGRCAGRGCWSVCRGGPLASHTAPLLRPFSAFPSHDTPEVTTL